MEQDERKSYRQVSDEVRQLAQQIDGVSLNGSSLLGGRRRKRSGAKRSKSPKRRSSAKKSGAKRSKRRASGKRSSKKSKKTMGPSFQEQLITLANTLKRQGVAGTGKPRRHAKKNKFTSLI